MNIFNLLDETAQSTTQTSQGGLFGGNSMLIWIVLAVVMIAFFLLSNRSNKKKMKEMQDRFNTIAVGDKVITIGFIEGYIVEILPDNTYVLKTGSDANPGYVTVGQRAIYKFFKPQELENTDETTGEQVDFVENRETTINGEPNSEVNDEIFGEKIGDSDVTNNGENKNN